MDKIKAFFIVVTSGIVSFLGTLAIPVFLLVGCNVIDYITGLIASKYRNEEISSYKGIRGIIKKVCQWLLILVGSWVDILINYALVQAGIDYKIPFIISIVVACWLVINEIISILENMLDIGVDMPPFLMPICKRIRKQTEDTCDIKEDK